MKICIRAAGRIKSGPERELINAYLNRARGLGRGLGIMDIQESEIDTRATKSRAEATKSLLSILKPGDQLVIMDETGKDMSSRSVATTIADWRDTGISNLVLSIGPADGFDKSALPKGVHIWSLGKMTWPHKLARVMLAEQLYRALSILAATPYHRD